MASSAKRSSANSPPQGSSSKGNVVQTATGVQQDIREIIFAGINGRQFSAAIVAEKDGVVAGIVRLQAALAEAGIER